MLIPSLTKWMIRRGFPPVPAPAPAARTPDAPTKPEALSMPAEATNRRRLNFMLPN
jgi:hypothetical protein